MRPTLAAGAFALAAVLALPPRASAQDSSVVVLDFGAAEPDTARARGIPDSVIVRALARFNADGTTRIWGDFALATGAGINGPLGVYGGDVRLAGRVTGDVVVINGDLRLEASARVEGTIVVLGGRFFPDAGARVPTALGVYAAMAAVRRLPDGTLVTATRLRSLRDVAGAATLQLGPVALSPRLGLGTPNRVEGLPIRLGSSLRWSPEPGSTATLDADLIVRTARDPSGIRDEFGWWVRGALQRPTAGGLRLSLEGGRQVVPVADAPFESLESGLSALFLRRDYRDWYEARGVRARATWTPKPALEASLEVARERHRSLVAVDAFSLFRGDEPWRANTLVDDGRFTDLALGVRYDTRDRTARQPTGWLVDATVRRTSGSGLTPVLLPEVVRGALPVDGYAAYDLQFDARRTVRLDPRHALALRVSGAGWIGGDPLTVQRRLALGNDLLPGTSFRAERCDTRRREDPAQPALCDRRLAVQAELRRSIGLRLGTRLGAYSLGLDQADLVVFGDLGSAWLAGDGPGRVPAGKIRALEEWRGDLGLGFDAGVLGVYVAKSVTDDDPIRLQFRLARRF
jgi:hypothetical protein